MRLEPQAGDLHECAKCTKFDLNSASSIQNPESAKMSVLLAGYDAKNY